MYNSIIVPLLREVTAENEIMNSPQKDLAIDALSSTLATPKSAVKKNNSI